MTVDSGLSKRFKQQHSPFNIRLKIFRRKYCANGCGGKLSLAHQRGCCGGESACILVPNLGVGLEPRKGNSLSLSDQVQQANSPTSIHKNSTQNPRPLRPNHIFHVMATGHKSPLPSGLVTFHVDVLLMIRLLGCLRMKRQKSQKVDVALDTYRIGHGPASRVC